VKSTKAGKNMSYINKIFERATVQQIVSFILCGTESNIISTKSYKERLDEVGFPVIQAIKEHFHDIASKEDFEHMVLDSWSEYESVFLEIGIFVGAKLSLQYLSNIE